MNPDRIYSQYRDEALAEQVGSTKLSTFVAMPFMERFSYRSKKVFNKIIIPAAELANTMKGNQPKRTFATPFRIDDRPDVARPITEEVVKSIIEAHIFLADLTFMNNGVIVELGIALGIKPNNQIICIMQGQPSELHFDLKDINVFTYNSEKIKDSAEKIAHAFISAGTHYESVEDRYVMRVAQTTGPDEIGLLREYAKEQNRFQGSKEDDKGKGIPLSHPDLEEVQTRKESELSKATQNSQEYDTLKREIENLQRFRQYFNNGIGELLRRRLVFLDLAPGNMQWGVHPTRLGWRVIKALWPEFDRLEERAQQE